MRGVRPIGAVTVPDWQAPTHGRVGRDGGVSGTRFSSYSDDGKCVDDAVIMRRAPNAVKAFDGAIAQRSRTSPD